MKFKIGDRLRCQNVKGDPRNYTELVVSMLFPATRQYGGLCVRHVIAGRPVARSTLVGFVLRVPAEDTMRRDWFERLTLVKESDND